MFIVSWVFENDVYVSKSEQLYVFKETPFQTWMEKGTMKTRGRDKSLPFSLSQNTAVTL